MTLNDVTRCTGITANAERVCTRRRDCERWLAYQRDLRTKALIGVSVQHMPDGFCSEWREAA